MEKVLIADFSNGKDRVTVRGLWQFDRGVKLKVIGINAADVNRVDFAPVIASEAVPVVVVPDEDGTFTVSIPGAATKSPYDVTAYIYVDTAEYGYTVKAVNMPVILRPEAGNPGEEKPDPFGEVVEKVSEYATEARDSARAAAESEKAASESATQAEKAKEASRGSAEKVSESKEAAATSATAAAESASQARESATVARSAADQAGKSATSAAESATAATQQAENATQSATNAARSAESATQSAETAKTAADTAGKSASSAQQAARSAAESASTATAAAQTATTAAGKTAESATSAGRSAENAGQKATAAETSASNAAESAAEAAKSATAAGDSAGAAKTSETAAEEAAQTAQEQAERITDSAEQIEKNKAGVAALMIEESVAGEDIVISDSAEMPLRGLRLFGKSEQKQYNGHQLISAKTDSIEKNGVTFKSEYGKVILNGTASADTMFTISRAASIEEGKTYTSTQTLLNGVKNAAIYSDAITLIGSMTATAKSSAEVNIYVYIASGAVFNNAELYITVEEGDTRHQWEPYTGGKPSPSPDYPQEITSAGDSGNIDIDVTGKNLVDIQNVKTFWAHTLSVSVDELNKHVGDMVTVTGTFDVTSVKSDKTSDWYEFRIAVRNEDDSYTAYASKKLNIAPKIGDRIIVSKTVKLSKKIKSILLYGFGADIIGALGTSKATVQIELGGVATPYKPFEKETLNLITPTGLPGIPVDSDGNYTDENGQQWVCDEVDFERGVYVQRVWTKEFDGSDDELWQTYESSKYAGFVSAILPEKMNRRKGFCNCYIVQEEKNISTAESLWLGVSGNTGMYLHNSRFYDITLSYKGLSNFKTYLAEHPFIVMTYLETPIETPLTADQIAAYKALTTHKTTTLISNDAGAGMEVAYVADPKTYIDNKFAELSQALIASASEAE